ncbi:MAG: phosphoribosyltransferase family protein, partial [Atopobiaceae bacterium]|nr:phosphoribosyltransferase family protein [Atopobiaceae bacterium]
MSSCNHPDIESIVLSEDTIKEIVARMGAKISEDYKDKNPLIITVLRGAFVFTADLVRAITVPCSVDFMAVSSYGDGVKSTGVVRIVKDLDTRIEGRHVVIAEDILDSGLTLSYL